MEQLTSELTKPKYVVVKRRSSVDRQKRREEKLYPLRIRKWLVCAQIDRGFSKNRERENKKGLAKRQPFWDHGLTSRQLVIITVRSAASSRSLDLFSDVYIRDIDISLYFYTCTRGELSL